MALVVFLVRLVAQGSMTTHHLRLLIAPWRDKIVTKIFHTVWNILDRVETVLFILLVLVTNGIVWELWSEMRLYMPTFGDRVSSLVATLAYWFIAVKLSLICKMNLTD